MKVNIGLCLVGVIIGEFIGARKGLGYLIIYGSQTFKLTWVLMSIVILCIIAMGCTQCLILWKNMCRNNKITNPEDKRTRCQLNIGSVLKSIFTVIYSAIFVICHTISCLGKRAYTIVVKTHVASLCSLVKIHISVFSNCKTAIICLPCIAP